MKEVISNKILWNLAAKNGLILGCTTTACYFLNTVLVGLDSAIAISIMSFLIWGIKFGSAIYLMHFFMKKLAGTFDKVNNRTTFKYGMYIALFSSVIFSGAILLDQSVISPERLELQMEAIYKLYSNILDSNSMTALESMQNSIPQITFFSNLIYCFIYGTVLSSILSNSVPKKDPFEGYMNEE